MHIHIHRKFARRRLIRYTILLLICNNVMLTVFFGVLHVIRLDRGRRSLFDRAPVMDVPELLEIGQCGRVVWLQPQRVLVRPFRLVQLVVDVEYGSQVAVARRVLRNKREKKKSVTVTGHKRPAIAYVTRIITRITYNASAIIS